MGIPQNTLSSQVIQAPFLAPRNLRTGADLLLDYEQGGIGIEDASQGLQVQTWTGTYDGSNILLASPATGAPVPVLALANCKTFGFTFDQQMRIFVAYQLLDDTAAFYWFDTLANSFTVTPLPVGSIFPRCSIDDKRPLEASRSDIVLSYTRAGTLYFRQQRDRYGVEYALASGLTDQHLIQVGISTINRFQWELTPP